VSFSRIIRPSWFLRPSLTYFISGLAMASRLKALGVESVILDQGLRVGDSWAKRYDCLQFHVPTSCCELPYLCRSPFCP
jgi:hypothetical protein